MVLCALAGAPGNVVWNLTHNILDEKPTDEILRQVLIDAGQGFLLGGTAKIFTILCCHPRGHPRGGGGSFAGYPVQ